MTERALFFRNEDWTLGVVGLGYVGLPLLMSAVGSGLRGIGFDMAEQRITDLAAGISHIDDVSSDSIAAQLGKSLRFTKDASELAEADAIFICVPSPLGRNREPDLSHIASASNMIADVARPGQLISLESTTYPGTTRDYILPAVERAGLTLDHDVWVAYSPERVSPGDSLKAGQIPKVVGGISASSGEVAAAAYRRIAPVVHLVSSSRVAEMTKLLENTYRAVNIGLINEIAQLSHQLDIDIWEVVDAAATKPFGFQPFYPGPGVGGHCIPLDPQYLAWRAREVNFPTRFIETADQVNAHMPEYTVERIAELLNDDGKSVRGSKILVIGIAYKPDVSDDRESASVDVAVRLLEKGADVAVIDPHVREDRIARHGFTIATAEDDFDKYQIAAVLTDHTDIPYETIARSVPRVFDARGVYRRLGIDADNVETL